MTAVSAPFLVYGLELERSPKGLGDPTPTPLEVLLGREQGEQGAEQEQADAKAMAAHRAAWQELGPLLDWLPPFEADLVELYYFRGCAQRDLGEIFALTQAGVSYRLDKARQRLLWLRDWPGVTLGPEQIRPTLQRHLDPFGPGVQVVCSYWRTTSQTRTALELGLTQGRTRHTTIAALRTLTKRAEWDPELEPIVRGLRMIMDAPNMLNALECGQDKNAKRGGSRPGSGGGMANLKSTYEKAQLDGKPSKIDGRTRYKGNRTQGTGPRVGSGS